MAIIYTGTTLGFTFNSAFLQADTTHPHFSQIVSLVQAGNLQEAADLLDLRTVVTKAIYGSNLKLEGNTVTFNGTVVNGILGKRIVEMVRLGFSVKPLELFLGNLMENPSKRAVDELYGFLEASSLPITDDGHFLAYKSVKVNFKDHHSGTFDNSPGSICEMPRNKVDEDKDRTCSAGLHFAAHEYAADFGRNGKMVVLKINPKDVVAIPSDYKNQKGRCCRYEVLEEVSRESTHLVGATIVGKVPEATEVPKDKVPEKITIGSRVTLNAEGIKKYLKGKNNPQNTEGTVTGIETYGFLVFRVKWDTGISNTYTSDTLDLVETYVPQSDNYDDTNLWDSLEHFTGKAAQFPVNRDVAYDIERIGDLQYKDYGNQWFFTE